MGSGKHRWKLYFHRSTPNSPPPPPLHPPPPPPPPDFLCPISGSLMDDPVITSFGLTFDRSSIQACKDLSFIPPIISSFSGAGAAAAFAGDLSSLLLIPNSALRSAILHWCHLSGHPLPSPLSPSSARSLLRRRFHLPDTSPSSSSSSYSSSSSSYSSSEILPSGDDPSPPGDSPESELLFKLKDPKISEQAAALASLRRATRESQDRRISLCTPALLAALRPMLLSRYREIQTNAVAALVNLSLEPKNKVPVVRSGAVPALIELLRCGHDEARDDAAGAVFSLSIDDDNKAAIGVLGAVPPLVRLFCRPSEKLRARLDAGMAIYHLCQALVNKTRVLRVSGAVRAVVAVAKEGGGVGKVALMVLCGLAACGEGRTAMMDADAVAAAVEIMNKEGEDMEEYCVGAIYGMSKGGLRFRAAARAAAVEEVLEKVAEKENIGEAVREMARRTVTAMRGEVVEEDGERSSVAEGSVASDGAVAAAVAASIRTRFWEFAGDDLVGINTAEF